MRWIPFYLLCSPLFYKNQLNTDETRYYYASREVATNPCQFRKNYNHDIWGHNCGTSSVVSRLWNIWIIKSHSYLMCSILSMKPSYTRILLRPTTVYGILSKQKLLHLEVIHPLEILIRNPSWISEISHLLANGLELIIVIRPSINRIVLEMSWTKQSDDFKLASFDQNTTNSRVGKKGGSLLRLSR